MFKLKTKNRKLDTPLSLRERGRVRVGFFLFPCLSLIAILTASPSYSAEGTVWAWGQNHLYDQLGDGSYTNRNTPVQVSGLTGVAAIAGGYTRTIALKSDGIVWTLGDSSDNPVSATWSSGGTVTVQ